MAPFFTVFIPNNKLCGTIINTLTKFYAPPLVDGISSYPQNFKDKYGGMNGRYFRFEGDDLLMFDNESIGLIVPQFLLSFDVGVKVSKDDWKTVVHFINAIFKGELSDDLKNAFETLAPSPIVYKPNPPESEPSPPENEEYEFQYDTDSENDITVVEIIKPFTDRPYTLILRQFSKRGFAPLFTGLYIATSWGVCSKDYAFLEKLWTHLELQKTLGPIDLMNRLKDDINKCEEHPELEPEMYRETLDEVIEKLKKSRERKHLLK